MTGRSSPCGCLVTINMFSWSWGVFCCLPLILQLFPTGKPVSRHWAVLVWLTLANAALGNTFVGPTPEYGASSFLVAPWWAVTEGIASAATPIIILASVISLVVRFIRGSETVRQQVLWLLVAVLLVILINVPIWFAIPTGQNILLLLSFPLIPAAVTIAVLRHGLYDVRIVLSRVVVYAVLTAGVIAIYVGLVAVLDRVLRGAGAPAVAALAIALAFNPVRVRCNAWSTAPCTAPAATPLPRCPQSGNGWPVTTSAVSLMPCASHCG